MRVQLHVASLAREFLRHALDDHVARVSHRVHRVAEADHDFLVGHAAPDVRLGLIGRRVTLLDHQRDFVGAAMFGAAQRADGAGDAGVDVRARTGDHARGERGGIEFVFGVEIQRGVHGAHPARGRRAPMQQVQEMAAHRIVVGFDVDTAGRCATSDTSSRASIRSSPADDRRSRARPPHRGYPPRAARSPAPTHRYATRPWDVWPAVTARARRAPAPEFRADPCSFTL